MPCTNTKPLKPESDAHEREATLFEEVFDAVKSSLLVYGAHDARKLAREGKLCMQDDPSLIEKMVQLPITEREGIELLKANLETIKEYSKIGSRYLAAFEGTASLVGDQLPKDGRTATSLVVFDDENSGKELVYGISINPRKKAICVCFRGSRTVTDWAVNSQQWLVLVENPVTTNSIPQGTRVGIHGEY
jgi:hypothetical protein